MQSAYYARMVKWVQEAMQSLTQKKKVLVCLCAGHGPETAKQGSKRSPYFPDGSYLAEYDFNYATVLLTREELQKLGFEVFFVNEFDHYDVSLTERAKRANALYTQAKREGKQVLYISVHADAAPIQNFQEWNNRAGGVTGFYYEDKDTNKFSQEGKRLAELLQKNLVHFTGLSDRSWSFSRSKAIGRNLGILRRTAMPSALVECGFMTNRKECELLLTQAYRRTCAQAIARSVQEFVATDIF